MAVDWVQCNENEVYVSNNLYRLFFNPRRKENLAVAQGEVNIHQQFTFETAHSKSTNDINQSVRDDQMRSSKFTKLIQQYL